MEKTILKHKILAELQKGSETGHLWNAFQEPKCISATEVVQGASLQ